MMSCNGAQRHRAVTSRAAPKGDRRLQENPDLERSRNPDLVLQPRVAV